MNKVKQISVIIVCLVCALAIGVSCALMLQPPINTNQSTYILREYNGKLALYDAQATRIYAEYDIYTQLLPTGDAKALRDGIKVNTPNELNTLLEDYGA